MKRNICLALIINFLFLMGSICLAVSDTQVSATLTDNRKIVFNNETQAFFDVTGKKSISNFL